MKNNFFKRLTCNRGITFSEVLISLFILSIVVVVLFRIGVTVLPSLIEDRGRILNQRKELLLRKALTHSFKQITPPWWESEYTLFEEIDSWGFPYFNGDKDSEFLLRLDGSNLEIIQGEQLVLTLAPVESLQVELIKDLSHSPYLVKLTIDGFIEGDLYFPLGSRIIFGSEVP